MRGFSISDRQYLRLRRSTKQYRAKKCLFQSSKSDQRQKDGTDEAEDDGKWERAAKQRLSEVERLKISERRSGTRAPKPRERSATWWLWREAHAAQACFTGFPASTSTWRSTPASTTHLLWILAHHCIGSMRFAAPRSPSPSPTRRYVDTSAHPGFQFVTLGYSNRRYRPRSTFGVPSESSSEDEDTSDSESGNTSSEDSIGYTSDPEPP